MKKVPRTVQPAHWSPTLTVAQAMRAWRKVEAEQLEKRGHRRDARTAAREEAGQEEGQE